MVKHCLRCGLPRRRPLLTPEGKTFSFPGFAVRRHRGLLLASGAAQCCCCVDQLGIKANSDIDNPGGWTGATYTNIDEWPSDDATTEAVVTFGPTGEKTASFGTPMQNHPAGNLTIGARLKIKNVSGTPTGTNSVAVDWITDGTHHASASLVWSAGNDDVWTTVTASTTCPEQTVDAVMRIRANCGLNASFEFHVSAGYFDFLCP